MLECMYGTGSNMLGRLRQCIYSDNLYRCTASNGFKCSRYLEQSQNFPNYVVKAGQGANSLNIICFVSFQAS